MTEFPSSDQLKGDWTSWVRSLEKPSSHELDLRHIKAGDRVLIKTRNTLYLLDWKSGGVVELLTNSSNAPRGSVKIMGCTFGHSSSIRPNYLTCGTNLELTFDNGNRTWTTSPIEEIYHLNREEAHYA